MKVMMQQMWQGYIDRLPEYAADKFIDAEDAMTEKLAAVNEEVVAEYHMFIDSGGAVALPYPRVRRSGKVVWR